MAMVRSKRGALAALVIGAAALFGTTSARAIQYVGEWDPAYGGMFPNLGWSASALFDVPDACLALGNARGVPVAAGPCSGFSVLSAELRFYDVARPSAILERFALNTGVTVIDVDVAASGLAGVDTGFFDAVASRLPIAGSGRYFFSLDLEDGGLAQLACSTSPTRATAALAVGPSCGLSANAARGVFTAVAPPVPEPETWALMTAGLLGLGAVARRRGLRPGASRA